VAMKVVLMAQKNIGESSNSSKSVYEYVVTGCYAHFPMVILYNCGLFLINELIFNMGKYKYHNKSTEVPLDLSKNTGIEVQGDF
jgi:hypothetical protein